MCPAPLCQEQSFLPSFTAWQELAQAPSQVPPACSRAPVPETSPSPGSHRSRSLLANSCPFWVLRALGGGWCGWMEQDPGAGKRGSHSPTSSPMCSSTGLPLVEEGFPSWAASSLPSSTVCYCRTLLAKGPVLGRNTFRSRHVAVSSI